MPKSRMEIAAELNLSVERVGQIERRAHLKMRQLIHSTNAFPLLAESFADILPKWKTEDEITVDKIRQRNTELCRKFRDKKKNV